jgi:tetratricopeptide (TPR) repeat protein
MTRLAILAMSMGLVVASSGRGQVKDVVYYRDRSAKPEKTSDFAGVVVAETVNSVRVKPLVGPERTFPVAEIVDIAFDPPTTSRIPFGPIINDESDLRAGVGDPKAKMRQLVKEYTTFISNFKDNKAIAFKRQIQYRLAMLSAELAEKREDQLEAIRALDQFRKGNSGGWQLMPVVRQEVQMLTDVDRLDEAVAILEEASKTTGLAKENKQDLELMLIDLMIQSGKANQVENRIENALKSLPPADPLAARLRVYLIGCKAGKEDAAKLASEITAIIDQTQDAGLKALAYNTLGDCYSAKGLKKDAMWAYLWVDVVYNQDKTEYVKAVDRLAKLFKDLNDDPRAEKYREKLKMLR